jgi:hypothetical protein
MAIHHNFLVTVIFFFGCLWQMVLVLVVGGIRLQIRTDSDENVSKLTPLPSKKNIISTDFEVYI